MYEIKLLASNVFCGLNKCIFDSQITLRLTIETRNSLSTYQFIVIIQLFTISINNAFVVITELCVFFFSHFWNKLVIPTMKFNLKISNNKNFKTN